MLRQQTYMLADRLGTQQFLNAVNNDFADSECVGAPWYEVVIFAFSNIPLGRRILKLLVETHYMHSTTYHDTIYEHDA
jgi:hypothetical protein